jgi:hypothetical protein
VLAAKDEQIRALREVAKLLARKTVETWALSVLRHIYRAWADYTLVRAVQRDEALVRDEALARHEEVGNCTVQVPEQETNESITARARQRFLAALPKSPRERAGGASWSGAHVVDTPQSAMRSLITDVHLRQRPSRPSGSLILDGRRHDDGARGAERAVRDALVARAEAAERVAAAALAESAALHAALRAAEQRTHEAEAEARLLRAHDNGLRAQLQALETARRPPLRTLAGADARRNSALPRTPPRVVVAEPCAPASCDGSRAIAQADPHVPAAEWWAGARRANAAGGGHEWAGSPQLEVEALSACLLEPMPLCSAPRALQRASSFERLSRAPGVSLSAEAYGRVQLARTPSALRTNAMR